MASYSVYHNANFQSFVRHDYRQGTPMQTEYEEIRHRAQQQHSHQAMRKARSATVYAGEYRSKDLHENCQPVMRPSSPTRMNKPHPPEVFLVTTLHNLPGYYNCKKGSSSKEKGNATVKKDLKGMLYEDNKQVHIFRDTDSNAAARAWLKLASDRDCSAIMKMMKFVSSKQEESMNTEKGKSTIYQRLSEKMKPEFKSLAQQWLLKAGPQESAAVEKLLSTLSMVHQSQTSEDKTTSLPVCKPYRAEYLIHPDWRSEQ
ncbi:uncharacterized protein LOC120919487 [Rana temporaria]|uniref:uncharacterized protein LOC120919487 n=1 Tax=Rana temporaria TaxID=8407 RepID=UPI001AACBD42|nr:uncharacterized protein LOC120919487 [Rana temporaria]